VKSEDTAAEFASRTDTVPSDQVKGTELQDGPAYLKSPESEWPIWLDIMEDSMELPREDMRKQYRHQAFQQNTKHGSKKPRSSESALEKHELDHISDSTNNWSTALKITRTITRWLEKHRTTSIQLTWARGWMQSLQMEHKLANLATKLGLACWLNDAGKETITLMEKGGLRSTVIEINQGLHMVHTRFKVKTQNFFGATELPLILASTRLGFLLCFDAHEQTHQA
jgi:hypothetical protein